MFLLKAIILAGGEGVRLRPVSCGLPKPMVRLLDKPLLEHIVRLLVKNGITGICLTLGYLSDMVISNFRYGDFGAEIESRVETEPLGTAGSVKACEDFIGGEDFLVISGDAACDLNLSACMEAHEKRDADVTIALASAEEQTEYGLVLSGADGRIARFIEKPPASDVFTDYVNTGIYVVSAPVLREIPENTRYDFAKDLFPKLLGQGKRLFAFRAEGYWRDLGNCEAYLTCCMDALTGKLQVEKDAAEISPGIWSRTGLKADAGLTPPCYIGKGAIIENGAQAGPAAVIGAGSHIEAEALVSGSVIEGAHIGKRASVSGAVVCAGACLGSCTVVEAGAVIGAGAQIGAGSHVCAGVRVWPNAQVPPGSRLTENINEFMPPRLRFSDKGVLSGSGRAELTPKECAALGAAVGGEAVGICSDGKGRVRAMAFEAGVLSSGADVMELDCDFEAAASWAGMFYSLPLTVFARERAGGTELRFFSEKGLPIDRQRERDIEQAVNSPAPSARAGSGTVRTAEGILFGYAAEAARKAAFAGYVRDGRTVSVAGRNSPARALRNAFGLMGAGNSGSGGCEFFVAEDGLSLEAKDELGRIIPWERLLAVLVFLEFANGSGEAAVSGDAPAALELIAESFGASVLRTGKGGKEADSLFERQRHMHDGVFAAARIFAGMSCRKESLASLSDRLPRFSIVRKEIPIHKNGGALMRSLAESAAEASAELSGGLLMHTGRGLVSLSLCPGQNALRISAESSDTEAAEELCADFEKRSRQADS